MIIGVPGSGKIEIVLRAMRIVKKMKKKMLLIAYNMQTIDNVIIRLTELQKDTPYTDRVNIVKVASITPSSNPKVAAFTNPCTTFESIDSMKAFITKSDVFVTLIHTSTSTFLQTIPFTHTFFLEASLILEPLAINPILLSSTFTMLGDYYQLNPTIKSYPAD